MKKAVPEIIHINEKEKLPFEVTILTFRTASKSKVSAYEIGILTVLEGQELINKVIRINPQTKTFSMSEENEGITYEDVKDEPIFSEVWNKIKIYIENKTLVMHYAEFHENVMLSMLKKYKIEIPKYKLIDIIDIAREVYPELENYKFKTIAKEIGEGKVKWDTAKKITTMYSILFEMYDIKPEIFKQYVKERKPETIRYVTLEKQEPISEKKQGGGCLTVLMLVLIAILFISWVVV